MKIKLTTSGQNACTVHEAVELRCMEYLELQLSPVLTSDASISTSISTSIKDAYALVRTATT